MKAWLTEYVKNIFEYLNLLLHLCLWFFLPYPGRQKHEETPNFVLHTSCFSFSHVLSSPTIQVSILKDRKFVFYYSAIRNHRGCPFIYNPPHVVKLWVYIPDGRCRGSYSWTRFDFMFEWRPAMHDWLLNGSCEIWIWDFVCSV